MVAHADWYVGWETSNEDDEDVPAPPSIERIRPRRVAGPKELHDLDLDPTSAELERLWRILYEYGGVCFHDHHRQRAGEDVRVRDVVRIEDGVLVVIGLHRPS
jgi:hypothetical protein